jgi:hypothetical protein
MGSQFDVAPTELARILSWRGYKDLAPTEHPSRESQHPSQHLRVRRLLVTATMDLKPQNEICVLRRPDFASCSSLPPRPEASPGSPSSKSASAKLIGEQMLDSHTDASVPVLPLKPILRLWPETLKRLANANLQAIQANSNPENSKPGATVQPTRVHAPKVSAVCQACAGTMACGRS